MAGLETALGRVAARGWRVMELGRYVRGTPSEQPQPWFCALCPGHFGSHFAGTRGADGCYRNAMATVRGNGRTATESVEAAIAALDASDARDIYDDLTRAVGEGVAALERLNGTQAP